MKKTAAADLVELSRACEILEPGAFVLGGVKTVVGNDAEALERALSERIYHQHYCRPSGSGGHRSMAGQADLLAEYRRANRTGNVMEPGWRFVRRDPDGRVVVERYGVQFWTPENHVEPRAQGKSLAAGDEVFAVVPGERMALVYGFYFFTGKTTDRSDGSPMARFYWNITERGAAPWVARLSSAMNGAKIPYRAKVLSNPSDFRRADAGVLYLRRHLVGQALPLLRALYTNVQPFLRRSVPMFTLRLAPGLGAADDPGEHTSFGQHRCQTAARGLLSSYAGSPPSEKERLASVVRAYTAAGLCPTQTHLGSVGAEPYPRFAIRKSSMDISA